MSSNKHSAAVALIRLVLRSAGGSGCAATTPSLAGALTPEPGVHTVSVPVHAAASQVAAAPAQPHAASAPSAAVTQTQPPTQSP
jgi:hypothetical protein